MVMGCAGENVNSRRWPKVAQRDSSWAREAATVSPGAYLPGTSQKGDCKPFGDEKGPNLRRGKSAWRVCVLESEEPADVQARQRASVSIP